jgi:hypothetical protein
MKKIVFMSLVAVVLVSLLGPGIAVASVDCQAVRQYVCTKEGCEPDGWCLYCHITNPDGSDGGSVTDC